MQEDIQKQPQGAEGGGTGLSSHFGQQSGSEPSPQAGGGSPEAGGNSQEENLDPKWKAFKDQVLDEARRTAQSISDKAASVSKKAYQEAMGEIERLKGMGIQMTPQQEQAIRDQKLDSLMKQEQGEPGAQAPQPSQGQNIDMQQVSAEPSDALKQRVNGLIEVAGMQLTSEEMAAAGLSPQLWATNEDAFAVLYEAKLQEKVKGVQPSRAAIPGIGTGGQSVGLEANYLREMKAARGDKRKVTEIQQRYQKQGLKTWEVQLPI